MSQTKKLVADKSVMIGGKHCYPGHVLELDEKQEAHLKNQGVNFTKPSKEALKLGHEPKEDSPAEA